MMKSMKAKLMSILLAVSVVFGSLAIPTTVLAWDFDDDDEWYYDDDYYSYEDRVADYLYYKALKQAYEEEHRYVNVTGVCVSSTAVQLPIGGRYQITGYVLPDNANNKGVCYYSTNPAIAVVDGNGVITALNPGTCNIMTRTSEGGYEACTCLTVYPATVQLPIVR